MLLKIAVGNVRRSFADYSVYFFALTLAACLLYSFTTSGDYLLALNLTADQRQLYGSASMVTQAFSVFSVMVFAFLIAYANRFILRRRAREFALYELLGMGAGSVGAILCLEGVLVGMASLVAGILLGVAASPVLGAVAAFVFDAPYRPMLVYYGPAALWTAGCFTLIMVLTTALSIRDLRKRSLTSLLNAEKAPDRPRRFRCLPRPLQLTFACVLLALVWGTCILQPIQFVVWILPLGIAAVFATGILFRLWAQARPVLARRNPDRYWRGLRCFDVRQAEERMSSSANALACACALVAVGICMMVAGFAFSVGMRSFETNEQALASALAPIGFVGIFYGLTFLVSAAAVLALQLLTSATDSAQRYRMLSRLGCEERMLRRSVRSLAGSCFAAPLAFALVHCLFGFALIAFLAMTLGSQHFWLIAAACIARALSLFAAYYLLAYAACKRMLLKPVVEQ